MGSLVYSASPFQAFLNSFGTILSLLGLGVVGIAAAIIRPGQSRTSRLLLGGAGFFLVLAGSVMGVLTLASLSSSAQSVSLQLDNKRVVEDNCGDNGQTCTRYVLEAATSAMAYEFSVPRSAYDQAQVNTCYKITYYPSRSLLPASAATYQQISSVTRIETADPSTCH